MVPVLVLLFVALRRFVLCLTVCHFVLVFFSPVSIAITSLGEERANLSVFRTFVLLVLVWICRFPLSLSVWEGLRFVIVAFPGLFSYLFFFLSTLLFIHFLLHITKTCLYNFDPLKPHFYIVKLGFTGVYIIFLISAQNIDCRIDEAVLTSTHNLCFEQKKEKYQSFLSEIFQFLGDEILYISVQARFRNELHL